VTSSMCPVVGLKGFWCQVGHKTLLHVIAFAGGFFWGGAGERGEGGIDWVCIVQSGVHAAIFVSEQGTAV
jgi:hypothetical protein